MTARAVGVIGSDSLIGGAIAADARSRGFVVTATTRRTSSVDDDTVMLDLGREDPIPPRLLGLDVVVICAALTRLKACDDDPVASRRVNVEGTLRLARALRPSVRRLIFLSTDRVFSGTVPDMGEQDTPNPTTTYGGQKAEAEAALLGLGGVAVLRLTKVLDVKLPLLQGWREAARNGAPVVAFHDMVAAPIALPHVVDAVWRLADAPEGIYHLSGAQDVTYERLARDLSERWGHSSPLVQVVSAAGTVPEAHRPPHTRLSMRRTSAVLGLGPVELAEVSRRVTA